MVNVLLVSCVYVRNKSQMNKNSFFRKGINSRDCISQISEALLFLKDLHFQACEHNYRHFLKRIACATSCAQITLIS